MKKKILLIDDSDKNFNMLSKLLKADGYEIAAASSGQEGLSRINDFKPDIVLLDLMDPKMNSFEICRELKMNENTEGISIIVFTSFATPEDKKNAMDSKADGFIEKPINPETFVSQMQSIVKSIYENGE
jgi:two-component system cell cycle response regulator DivK